MIKARVKAENPDANLKSYFDVYRSFAWEEVKREFFHTDTGLINVVKDSIDKWADDPATADTPAIVYDKVDSVDMYTYKQLQRLSAKWANLLARYNFKPGDRLFIFLPPCPEIYVCMIACARIGVIFCPLYPTLGRDELTWCFQNAEPRGLVTIPALVDRLPAQAMSCVKHVFYLSEPRPGRFQCEAVLDQVAEHVPDTVENRWLVPDAPLYLLYTSGSTGPPKGVLHSHQDMYGWMVTSKWALDLSEESVIWTDSEPAWVMGTVYGAFGPWLCGASSVIVANSSTPERVYAALERRRIETWYTTPMTLKRLMEGGAELVRGYDLSRLKLIATVGQSLTPDVFFWVKEHLGRSPHDTWWMAETGMICISNFPSELIKPGSMGKPTPGIEAAVMDMGGEPLPIYSLGELALKAPWPSLMKGIWRDDERHAAYFRDGWFLTGDMVVKDEDGYYYHQGRNDDLIRIGPAPVGPYEFEHAFRLHPAVMDAAVIAKNSETGDVIVKAFVELRMDHSASDRLARTLATFVDERLHCGASLIEIVFVNELPKTRTGKLLRRALRAMELGLPLGDTRNLKAESE